jgi:hypothetical protein
LDGFVRMEFHLFVFHCHQFHCRLDADHTITARSCNAISGTA